MTQRINAARIASVALIVVASASLTLAQSRRERGPSGRSFDGNGRGDATTRTTSRPATTTPARPGASTVPSSHFDVITERNMFLRERRRPRPPVERVPEVVKPPPPLEQTLVLRGVVIEDEGGYRAYFENTQTNELIRVAAGDLLAKGHVAEISIDAVAFETTGGLTWVKVGDNLVGARVAAAPTPTVASSPEGGSTTGPAGESDVARRMRERREQAAQQRAGSGR